MLDGLGEARGISGQVHESVVYRAGNMDDQAFINAALTLKAALDSLKDAQDRKERAQTQLDQATADVQAATNTARAVRNGLQNALAAPAAP